MLIEFTGINFSGIYTHAVNPDYVQGCRPSPAGDLGETLLTVVGGATIVLVDPYQQVLDAVNGMMARGLTDKEQVPEGGSLAQALEDSGLLDEDIGDDPED